MCAPVSAGKLRRGAYRVDSSGVSICCERYQRARVVAGYVRGSPSASASTQMHKRETEHHPTPGNPVWSHSAPAPEQAGRRQPRPRWPEETCRHMIYATRPCNSRKCANKAGSRKRISRSQCRARRRCRLRHRNFDIAQCARSRSRCINSNGFALTKGSSLSAVDLSIKLNSVAPSLQLHYRAFPATTRKSAPVPRIGSLVSWGFQMDFSLCVGATGSHVPHKSLEQGHAAFMPDAI